MRLTESDKYHLMGRACFFAHHNDLPKQDNPEKLVNALFREQQYHPLTYPLEKLDREALRRKSAREKKELRKEWRKQAAEINAKWIRRMVKGDSGLTEKMTLFWHGHFACRTITNPYHTIDLNNRLRRHALGNFRDLLFAVAQSPAMIDYLHLKQNRKGKPNEDFARELCELFTLGRDVDYTEQDVSEIARAFTGWTINKEGAFAVNPRQHDAGVKTIFGKTGNFTGDDVIDMILENPHTADFIAGKVYAFFVREQGDPAHVKELAEVFFNSGYDIEKLMKHLFTAQWFYQAKGQLIKSPIGLIVSLGQLFELQYADTATLIRLQRYLGQVLFDPPNVAGWAGGRSWIDASRLAFRLRLGALLVNRGVVEDELSPELDEMLEKKSRKKTMRFYEEVDWEAFWKKNKDADLFELILRSPNAKLKERCQYKDNATVIQLISAPDFQLI